MNNESVIDDMKKDILDLGQKTELLRNRHIAFGSAHSALSAQVDQLEKDTQSNMKRIERIERGTGNLGMTKSMMNTELFQYRAETNVATEFHGEAPALADGTYKNTPEEAARAGFGSYVVKDGKIVSVTLNIYEQAFKEAILTGTGAVLIKDGKVMNVDVSKMQEPYTSSPTIMKTKSFFDHTAVPAVDSLGDLKERLKAQGEVIELQNVEIDKLTDQLEVSRAVANISKTYGESLEREIIKLKRDVTQYKNHKKGAEESFNMIREVLHCPENRILGQYIRDEVAPFIQSIVDLMQEHEFKGATKDMPEQIAEWLKLFVHNTNAFENINARFEEKCADNAKLQTQLEEANQTIVNLEQQVDLLTVAKPAVYFMKGTAKVDMAVAGRHRDSHGRVCIEVRDPNS